MHEKPVGCGYIWFRDTRLLMSWTLKILRNWMLITKIAQWNHLTDRLGWASMAINEQGSYIVFSTYCNEGLQVLNNMNGHIVDDKGRHVHLAKGHRHDHRYYVNIFMPFDYTKHKWLLGKAMQTFPSAKWIGFPNLRKPGGKIRVMRWYFRRSLQHVTVSLEGTESYLIVKFRMRTEQQPSLTTSRPDLTQLSRRVR